MFQKIVSFCPRGRGSPLWTEIPLDRGPRDRDALDETPSPGQRTPPLDRVDPPRLTSSVSHWSGNAYLLPSANEVCEGYVFTRVCHSVHRGVSRPIPRKEVGGSGWGISRPIPRGEVEGSGWGGVSRPIPRGRLGVWLEGSPGPGLGGGVSRPRPQGSLSLGPGGSPGPGPGGAGPGGRVCPSMHWGWPPSRQLLLRTVRILLECILVIYYFCIESHSKIFHNKIAKVMLIGQVLNCVSGVNSCASPNHLSGTTNSCH